MRSLIAKLFKRRKAAPAFIAAADTPRSTPHGKTPPEWEKVLLVSFEENNLAPSEETILIAYDLFLESLFGPMTELGLQISESYAEIVAIFATLKAFVPDFFERTLARHPFEFSQIRKEDF